ncbi:MAG: UDP-N-acetylmuramate dehydrogenase [Firmicutes bacterium]|nr:UDP-N-acetylmuramate dehydrogenase [Bacillota bacterium]
MNFLYNEILNIIGDKNRVLKEVPLSEHTTFKIGGPADIMVFPKSADELRRLTEFLRSEKFQNSGSKKDAQQSANYFIIGNGSNLLVRDGGLRGVVIKIGSGMSEIKTESEILTVQAGALLSAAAAEAARASLTGMEFASGIPGSFGGAVFMNAGAYDGEMAQIIESVTALMQDGTIRKFKKDEVDFGYRHSVFCDIGGIILEGEIRLRKGNSEKIREKMKELSKRRTDKQPLSYPSAGSTFKRPEGYFAGKLVEDSGCKGLSLGGAQVSPKHAGFIVNTGNAKAQDVIDLIKLVQMRVKEKFGVDLETEVKIIGE